jgi:hypothetical protein
MTAQTIVTIKGKGERRYSLHDTNHDGSVTVYGPVVHNPNTGRGHGTTKGKGGRYMCVNPDLVSPLEGAT